MSHAIELIKAINAADGTDDMPWRERINKKRLEMDLLGHNALMLDKVQRDMEINRQGMRALQAKTIEAIGGNPGNTSEESEGDAMGVNIGDQIHYHIDDRDTSNKPAGLSGLAKAGIGAALASGIAGPLLGAWLATRQPAPAKPVDAPAFNDTDQLSQPTVNVHD